MSNQSFAVRVAVPYAEALFDSTQNAGLLVKTSQDVLLIAEILEKSKDLKYFLDNPLIDIKNKKNVLTKLFTGQINSSVLNFLLILVDRRRITLLNLIIEKYLELAYQLNSTKKVEIVTASAFTEEQQKALIEKLKCMTNSKKIRLDIRIDSKLIGGFKIQIGSKIIDTSLFGKLKQIASHLDSY